MSELKFAVLGAGAGGQSIAAVLADKGCTVRVMDKNEALIRELNEVGTITLTGKLELSGTPALFTTDAAQAIENVDVIMIASTTDGHEDLAEKLAPVIRPEQLVVLNPGMFCGALAFRNALKRFGCPYDIVVAETADLMYTCRRTAPGVVFHSGLKKKMNLASVPAAAAEEIAAKLQPYFPILNPVANILFTGLSGMSVGLHCVPMLMNVNRMDRGEAFEYYMDGITPSIARIAEKVDLERVALAAKLGLTVSPALDTMKKTYSLEGDTLYDVIQANAGYRGIKGPGSMAHRFCAEDTFGLLVSFSTLAKELEVPTPAMDAALCLISAATGIDYLSCGRTAEKIGLKGKSVDEILEAIS